MPLKRASRFARPSILGFSPAASSTEPSTSTRPPVTPNIPWPWHRNTTAETTCTPKTPATPPWPTPSTSVSFGDASHPKSSCSLHSENLHNDPLAPLSVEFGVEDPLPGPKVKGPVGDRQRCLVVEQHGLQMRVAIILASLVMLVVRPLWR